MLFFLTVVFLIIYTTFITKAETIDLLPSCTGQKCLLNLTDIAISMDGSFSLILDSSTNPYIKRVNILSGMVTDSVIIPLNESNPDSNSLKIGISKNDKKAFIYSLNDGKKTTSSGSYSFSLHNKQGILLEQTTNCLCSSGSYFDGVSCTNGTLDCTDNAIDIVCGCNNLNYLNICVAMATGVKRFTKGECGTGNNFSCTVDSHCPLGNCSNGGTFKGFTCASGKCKQIEFSIDPCSSPSSSGSSSFSSSVINIIDLTNNSVKTITPVLKNEKKSISTITFLDFQGENLIASNDDIDSPTFLIANSLDGKIIKTFSSPAIAKSIELSPNFRKAVITFKGDSAQTIGILNTKSRELTNLDIPGSIIFKIDEFLSMIDFNLTSDKAVASSLGGRHVLHLLDTINNRLTIKFLGKSGEGQTLSTIDNAGSIVVSVANNPAENGIVVYKLDSSNMRLPKILKTANFNDGSSVLDVVISPDNTKVLILIQKENEKKLKFLNLNDLSLLCEIKISDDIQNTFLASDPYGKYLLIPNFESDSVSLISDLQTGPIIKSITPNEGTKEGGTQFTIAGYVDPLIFTNNVKVCFRNNKFCSTSVVVLNEGKTITGITPKFPRASLVDVILTAEKKSGLLIPPSSSSSSIQCTKEVNTETIYKRAFKFE